MAGKKIGPREAELRAMREKRASKVLKGAAKGQTKVQAKSIGKLSSVKAAARGR